MNLEEKFFKKFDIEERELDYPDNFTYYPDITDTILLKLICILNKHCIYGSGEYGHYAIGDTIEEVKESVLNDCIINYNKIYTDVRTLFEEE